MKVRLKHSILKDGMVYKAGTVVDDSVLTPLLQGDQYVDRNVEDTTQGQVLLLTGITFSKPTIYGVSHIELPVTLAAGEAISLEDISERVRATLQPGIDYQTHWTPSDEGRVRQEVNKLQDKIQYGSTEVYDSTY